MSVQCLWQKFGVEFPAQAKRRPVPISVHNFKIDDFLARPARNFRRQPQIRTSILHRPRHPMNKTFNSFIEHFSARRREVGVEQKMGGPPKDCPPANDLTSKNFKECKSRIVGLERRAGLDRYHPVWRKIVVSR